MEEGRLHILLPAGIGDVAWVWSKFHAVVAERPVTFWLPKDEPHRAHDLLTLYGADVGFMPSLETKWVWDQPSSPILPDTCGIVAIQANRHLEAGRRIEKWYPDLPFRNPFPKTGGAVSYKNTVGSPQYVAVSMGAHDYMEGNLLPDQWAKLLRKIEKNVAPVLLLASRRSEAFLKLVLERFDPTYAPAVSVPLGEMMGVLQNAKAYIGLASGLTILATYGGVPTFHAYPRWLRPMPGTWETPDGVWDWCHVADLTEKRIVKRIAKLAARDHTRCVPRLTLFVGGPGSGKSTIIERDYSTHGVLIDSDRVQRELNPHLHPSVREAAKTLCREQFLSLLKQQASVVIAATGADFEGCAVLLREAKRHGFDTEVVYVRCEETVAWERNLSRPHPIFRKDFVVCWDRSIENIPRLREMADAFTVIDNGNSENRVGTDNGQVLSSLSDKETRSATTNGVPEWSSALAAELGVG